MIKLKNITKKYSVCNKSDIMALNDVSLTFPEKGLCIILGKSGGGKTTLLNILGGLDYKYQGELIFFDKKLRPKDLSNYRKDYVSFVFQDFNLIDDLDVSENLSIGYSFSGSDGVIQQEEALKSVGLEGYESRFPQELSGGEQQRVAVARALLKNSRVLLADEPTGNLDKKNSEEIFNLLKEISREKLVVVVSHNEKLSHLYADYIVCLEEGKVKYNSLPESDYVETYKVRKSNPIRFKIACVMAWYELTRKKGRTVATIFTLIICLGIIAFSLPLLFYNSSDPHYNIIRKNGYDKVIVNGLTYDSYNKLLEKGVKLTPTSVNNYDAEQCALVFSSKEDALDYGIEFYQSDGELPLRADTYYISDNYLRYLIMYGNNEAEIDGVKVVFDLNNYQLTDIVGNRLAEFGYSKTCAGVYRYPDSSFGDDEERSYYNAWYGNYITTELTVDRTALRFIKFISGKTSEFLTDRVMASGVLNCDEIHMGGNGSRAEYLILDDTGTVTTFSGDSCGYVMEDNGIYFNLDCFNSVFGYRYELEDLIDIKYEIMSDGTTRWTYSCKMLPPNLGDEMSFEITDRNTRKKENITGLHIKGIVLATNYRGIGHQIWFGGEDDLLKFNMLAGTFSAWADVSSIKPLIGGMRSMSDVYNCGFTTPVTRDAMTFEKSLLKNVRMTMLFVSIAIAVVSILSIGLLISRQILTRKHEVGIFKAMGAKSADISMIYIIESAVIAVLVTAFSVVVATGLTALINLFISQQFTIVAFNWMYALSSIAVILGLFVVGTFLPLLNLNAVSVIESMKSKADR